MSPRCEQWLASFFLLAGACLLVLVAYWQFAPPSHLGLGLEAVTTDIEIADSLPGRKREVVLRLDNHSGRPMRILGLGGC